MLKRLCINNYVLIDRLDIELGSGFSVITGETGAGKSIILGAMGLLMGQRAEARIIKTGEKKCSVEATFDIKGLALQQIFEDNDIDYDESECIIRREVTSAGKSRAFINDTPVPLALLKSVSAMVIDIHSQHQNLLMGREHFLINVLDDIARNEDILTAYKEEYSHWTATCRRLRELKEKQVRDAANRDFIEFQCHQIEEANLKDDEQEELERESEILGHAEDIKQHLYDALGVFADGENNLVERLRQAVQSLNGISGYFEEAAALAERLESARIELDDISAELQRSADQVEFDPNRLALVDERLSTIYDLQKKHGVDSVAELNALKERLRRQLEDIENADDLISEAETDVAKSYRKVEDLGRQLSDKRAAAARSAAESIKATLATLGMPGAVIVFEISRRDVPDAMGYDAVKFLFSGNKNVAPNDVSQTASGGEIARLMLALKAYVSQCRNLPTIIFDEIDTGVSGTMAEKMAQVMLRMGENCQVICITHLPQIAALGADHYRVFKQEDATGTRSDIVRLSREERIREIANMLSGEVMTDAAINNAKSLLGIEE